MRDPRTVDTCIPTNFSVNHPVCLPVNNPSGIRGLRLPIPQRTVPGDFSGLDFNMDDFRTGGGGALFSPVMLNLQDYTASEMRTELASNISDNIRFHTADNDDEARIWNTKDGTGGGNTQWTTPSTTTGPGSNNRRKFIYYEASGGGQTFSAARSAFAINQNQSWLDITNQNRILTVIANVAGDTFNDARNGLQLWASPTPVTFPNRGDSTWGSSSPSAGIAQTFETTMRGLAVAGQIITGWPYSNNYAAGSQITRYSSATFNSVYDGGWNRYIFTLPNTARHAGLYVEANYGGSFTADIAIASIEIGTA